MNIESVEGFEFAYFPVLKTAVGEVSSNDKGDFLFAQFFLSYGQRVPVHQRVAIGCKVKGRVLRYLNGPDTDDSGFFILSHEGRSDPFGIWLVVYNLFLLDDFIPVLLLLGTYTLEFVCIVIVKFLFVNTFFVGVVFVLVLFL